MSVVPPFRYLLRVRYGECDAQRVVFNARYGDYADVAAVEFLRAAFAPRPVFDGTFEYQVVRQLTEWRAPARFDDVIAIDTQVSRIGTTSFTLAMRLSRLPAGEEIATIETVCVVVDHETWAKRPLTEAERAGLAAGAAGHVVDHAGTRRGSG